MDSPAAGSRVRQTRKSIATRGRVIEAAIACFLDLGYHRTNTSEIAKRARITRGAVQYYFPTTGHVLTATAEHIAERIMADWEQRLGNIPPGVDLFDFAIDLMWEIARCPAWTVWRELEAAARTDAELRAILAPVSEALSDRQVRLATRVFSDLNHADPMLFDLCRLMNWYFLQGLSTADYAAGGPAGKQRLVSALKDLMHRIWGVPRLGADTQPEPALALPGRNG